MVQEIPPGVVHMLTPKRHWPSTRRGHRLVPVLWNGRAPRAGSTRRGFAAQVSRSTGPESRNSSKPPSSDGLHKFAQDSPERSANRADTDISGNTLKTRGLIVSKFTRWTPACGRLGDQPPERSTSPHLPPSQMVVTEHQAEIKLCSCGEPRGLPRRGQRPGAIRSLSGRGRLFEQLSVPAL